jgi:hypothetical protein
MHEQEYQIRPSFNSGLSAAVSSPSIRATRILNGIAGSSTPQAMRGANSQMR